MKRVLITGGTGLVGSRLSTMLLEQGYEVRLLSRRGDLEAAIPRYEWNVTTGDIDTAAFEGVDTVIHLAGAGIADKRWSKRRKKELIDSRVQSTILLAKTISDLEEKPSSVIGASAVGFYGNTGNDYVDESSPVGRGFLSTTTQDWEQSNLTLAKMTGVRSCLLRIGIILSTKGGAMEKIMLPFKFGIGNTLGSGKQYYPWIHIDDICAQFIFLMEQKELSGIFNGVAPISETNKAITKSIGKAMGRGLILPVPAFMLKLILGEMSQMVLLSSRVKAEKIQAAGYEFKYPELDTAVQHLIQENL